MSASIKGGVVHITISVSNGCVLVQSSQSKPVVGGLLDPVSQLALEIGMLANRAGARVDYARNPMLEFLTELVSPEGFGHAVSAEVRARAVVLLNRSTNRINGKNHGL